MSDESALIEAWLKIMAGVLFVILCALRKWFKVKAVA